ncbi:hypothetical protein ACSDQ9_06245 [Aestuariimicrobium soli]|uniref:hypothetical protein n=1 Tax=Aestuariimicrobium soli TaxID=2035834 RepID=UPI003EB9AB35
MRDVKFSGAVTRFASLEAFLQDPGRPAGGWEVSHGELPIHATYLPRGADTLFVTFSGAMSPKLRTVPAYQGVGTSGHLKVDRLFLSDSSLILDDQLRLGWYGGSTRQPDFQDATTRIIESVAGGRRVVLFGPSGGGFSALLQATRLPGSTAVVSNPQTDVKQFTTAAVERYLDIAWGIPKLDGHPLPFADEVVSLYQRPVDSSIVYLQNLGDTDHVEKHLTPFLSELHSSNRVVQLLPNLGIGHIGPDKESFARLFSVACEHSDWQTLSQSASAVELTRNM